MPSAGPSPMALMGSVSSHDYVARRFRIPEYPPRFLHPKEGKAADVVANLPPLRLPEAPTRVHVLYEQAEAGQDDDDGEEGSEKGHVGGGDDDHDPEEQARQ